MTKEFKECQICIEKYNKTNRARVKCTCGFECCRQCAKTYLLDRHEDPCCMSCKTKWNRKFLVDNFEKVFMAKTYKNYREDLLFERELGMLQGTQPYVEKQIKIEEKERDSSS